MLCLERVKLKRSAPRSHRPDPNRLRNAVVIPPRGLGRKRSHIASCRASRALSRQSPWSSTWLGPFPAGTHRRPACLARPGCRAQPPTAPVSFDEILESSSLVSWACARHLLPDPKVSARSDRRERTPAATGRQRRRQYSRHLACLSLVSCLKPVCASHRGQSSQGAGRLPNADRFPVPGPRVRLRRLSAAVEMAETDTAAHCE